MEHHQVQLQPHHQLTDVDHLHGQMINGVTMKITMPIATGTVALVVTIILVDGTLTVTHVNALIPMHQLKDVDPLAGPLILCVTMKTTMLIATGTVALVVTMTLVGGTLTAL